MSILDSNHPEFLKLKKQAKIDYNGMKLKISDLIPRMDLMLSNGLKNYETKDYEKSFIYLSRFVDAVEHVQKQKDFKNHPRQYNLPDNQKILSAKTTLAAVHKTLIAKFTAPKLPNQDSFASKDKSNILNNYSDDVLLDLPETPTDDPVNDEAEEFIKCTDFFKIAKEPGKYLIIDVRSESDFLKSSVKSERVVCIPEEEIEIGKAAHLFETNIKKRSYAQSTLYKERGKKKTDQIILLDWSTSSDNMKENSKISIMKKILTTWDKEQCPRVFILDGGFNELLNVFPMFVTDPNVTQFPQRTELDDLMNSVQWEYPNYILDTTKEPINNKTISAKVPPKPAKFKTSKKSEKIIVDDDDFSNLSGDLEKVVLRKPDKIIPTINRKEKPTAHVDSGYFTELKDLLTFNIELCKEHEKFIKQICDLERRIISIINSDNIHPHDDDVESLKEQINTVLLTLDATVSQKANVQEKLKDLQEKNGSLAKNDEASIENLKLTIKSSEIRVHNLSQEMKTFNHQRIEEEKKAELQNSRKDLRNDTYKEPLKSDGSGSISGLKRSSSSPNLAKSQVRAVPFFDRSTKPFPIQTNLNESNIALKKISWKDRTRNMDPVFRDGHPGITGLKNLGNSCYMNSIIQCLSNTAYMSRYFIDSSYRDDLNTGPENETRGQIAEEFAQVIRALWRGAYKSIAPRDLKHTIGLYRFQYQSTEQQDSHEFLTFLLDWMHNDLKKNTKLKPESLLGPAEKSWDKAFKGQTSIISNLFMGQLRSTIKCSICDKKSITYETFSSLSISLPDARCVLDECIKRYLVAQTIQGWSCPNCKTARDASKKFDFVKLPPVLIIHLNRFAGTDIKLEKKNTSVSFPLDDLNLQQHVVEDTDTIKNRNSYIYHLYGLSNHSGSMDSGHYTAFCKNSGLNKWYQFNDQTVTEISQNDVKTQNTSAYLLFYTSYYAYIDDN